MRTISKSGWMFGERVFTGLSSCREAPAVVTAVCELVDFQLQDSLLAGFELNRRDHWLVLARDTNFYLLG